MKTRCLAAICLSVISSGTLGSQVKPPRPNIVFILADDLGVNDLGVYGRKEHRTPTATSARLAIRTRRKPRFDVPLVTSDSPQGEHALA